MMTIKRFLNAPLVSKFLCQTASLCYRHSDTPTGLSKRCWLTGLALCASLGLFERVHSI